MVSYIQKYGNQLALIINGEKYLGVPNGNDVWLLNSAEPGPGPDPDPDPSAGFAWPFPTSSVTSEYGPRNGRIHQGIDMGQSLGTPIPASNNGTIYNNPDVYHSGFGWWVVINHGVINGKQLYTYYGHMREASPFNTGDTVAKGEIIGYVNNTGSSQGNHLHWETHIANAGGAPTNTNPGTHINPRTFMASYGEDATVLEENGTDTGMER